jgi:peptidase E
MATGHIVALGGGGFSMEPDNPLLDDFILSLSSRQPARVCFVPTASADSATYIAKFYRTFSTRCIPTDLTLFDPPTLPRRPARTADLPDFVAEQDVFYVGGGNTAHMLAIWRTHGLDRLLRGAWESGAVLAGISAGMNCWFRASLTDSFGAMDALHDGLGLIDASGCPHYDGEVDRRPVYHRLVAGGFPGGYAADDGVGLHFVGTTFAEAVSSRPAAGAYRVELAQGGVVETRLPVRFLGAGPRHASNPDAVTAPHHP